MPAASCAWSDRGRVRIDPRMSGLGEPRPSNTRRLGGGMIAAAWGVGLLLLTLWFNGYLERREHPNQGRQAVVEGGVRQVVLQRNRAGHYLADGRINGRPVRFLLDTGATDVALSAELARELDLDLGPSSLSRTANGLVETRSARLQSVDVSGIELYDIRAIVLPNMAGDEVLLGMSFLKHLQLIQDGDQLVLRRPE